MDAKEILRLLIRYRFWIVVGIAALLPIIGYFVTAGSVRATTEAKAGEITTARQGAQSYASGTVPNGQYGAFTRQKIAAIGGDVDEAHRHLYERQAPLLDWPEEVAPELTSWGRDIPEDISANETQAVAFMYSQVYDKYAENVFKAVNPWEPISGEGVVVTPPLEQLLQTVTFDINDLPSISKVWQYQENLWVRRSILEVVAQVNQRAGATDWETAAIKQINRLEVGNPLAVDHRTTAEGFELKDPPEVTHGGQSLEPEAAMPGMEGMAGMEGMDDYAGSGGEYYGDMMGGMMDGMMGMMGTQGGGPVKFLQPEGVDLFRDYPAHVSVLIDQNSIQNFLVEFENSPMTMRVVEANWTRPATRVQPPVKGQGYMGYAGMGFGMGMGGGLYGMMDPSMMGMDDYYGDMYGGMGRGMGMMDPSMMGMDGYGMGMMGRGMGGLNQPRQKVQRKLGQDQQKKKDALEPEKVTIFDPYYNIVELQVYVQARFYYPPAPEQPADELSPGDPDFAGEPADESMIDGEPTASEDMAAPEPDPTAEDAPAPEAPDAEPAGVPLQEEPAEPGVGAEDLDAFTPPAIDDEPTGLEPGDAPEETPEGPALEPEPTGPGR